MQVLNNILDFELGKGSKKNFKKGEIPPLGPAPPPPPEVEKI